MLYKFIKLILASFIILAASKLHGRDTSIPVSTLIKKAVSSLKPAADEYSANYKIIENVYTSMADLANALEDRRVSRMGINDQLKDLSLKLNEIFVVLVKIDLLNEKEALKALDKFKVKYMADCMCFIMCAVTSLNQISRSERLPEFKEELDQLVKDLFGLYDIIYKLSPNLDSALCTKKDFIEGIEKGSYYCGCQAPYDTSDFISDMYGMYDIFFGNPFRAVISSSVLGMLYKKGIFNKFYGYSTRVVNRMKDVVSPRNQDRRLARSENEDDSSHSGNDNRSPLNRRRGGQLRSSSARPSMKNEGRTFFSGKKSLLSEAGKGVGTLLPIPESPVSLNVPPLLTRSRSSDSLDLASPILTPPSDGNVPYGSLLPPSAVKRSSTTKKFANKDRRDEPEESSDERLRQRFELELDVTTLVKLQSMLSRMRKAKERESSKPRKSSRPSSRHGSKSPSLTSSPPRHPRLSHSSKNKVGKVVSRESSKSRRKSSSRHAAQSPLPSPPSSPAYSSGSESKSDSDSDSNNPYLKYGM